MQTFSLYLEDLLTLSTKMIFLFIGCPIPGNIISVSHFFKRLPKLRLKQRFHVFLLYHQWQPYRSCMSYPHTSSADDLSPLLSALYAYTFMKINEGIV